MVREFQRLDYEISARARSRCRKLKRFKASSGVGCAEGVGSRSSSSTLKALMLRACVSGTGRNYCSYSFNL